MDFHRIGKNSQVHHSSQALQFAAAARAPRTDAMQTQRFRRRDAMPLKFRKILIAEERHETAAVFDVNGDGALDIVISLNSLVASAKKLVFRSAYY